MGEHRLGRGDPDHPGAQPAQPLGLLFEGARARLHLLRRVAQRAAVLGQAVAGAAAGEERQAERVLERLHPAADGGLVQPEAARGLQRGPGAGHREKDAQVAPLEHGLILHGCRTVPQAARYLPPVNSGISACANTYNATCQPPAGSLRRSREEVCHDAAQFRLRGRDPRRWRSAKRFPRMPRPPGASCTAPSRSFTAAAASRPTFRTSMRRSGSRRRRSPIPRSSRWSPSRAARWWARTS